jgi:hypothetical protein
MGVSRRGVGTGGNADAALYPDSQPACLLPDDDTAVQRLAAAKARLGSFDGRYLAPRDWAELFLAALREGGQPE